MSVQTCGISFRRGGVRALRALNLPLLTRKKSASTFRSSLVVEVPGIEPGSFRAQAGLLRV